MGQIVRVANIPTADQKAAMDAASTPSATNKFLTENDAVVSAHADTHATAGDDAIAPSDIGAVADNDARLSDARTPTSHGNEAHSSTFVADNDSRLSDARTPTSHGNEAHSSTFVADDDSRLSDARTPTSHGDEAHTEDYVTQSELGEAGFGNVVGDDASVAGNIAAFADTSGKVLEDSGYSPADFAADDHNHSGVYEPADSAIQTHVGVEHLPLATATEAHTPSGFVHLSDSTLSLDENYGAVNDTFRVTITGTNFPVYINGQRVLKNTASVTQVGATTRRYYVYYAANGTMTVSESPWSLEAGVFGGEAPICTVYWDAVSHQGVLEEERHHMWRDIHWHHWAHDSIGARYSNGFGVSKPVASGDIADFSILQGEIYDEDIALQSNATAATACTLWYHSGAAMVFERNSATLYKASAGVPQYDNGTGLAGKTQSNTTGYFVSWVYGGNTYSDTQRINVIIGQDTDGTMTLSEAQAVSPPSVPVGFIVEWKLLYKIIWRYGASATTWISTTDYRQASSLPTGLVPTTNVAASAVSYAPVGDQTATNVQGALEDSVCKKTFGAHTVLAATDDDTPAAVTITEQTVLGRATGGNIAAIAIDSDLSSVSANNDTVPSAKATKAALDLKMDLAGGTLTGNVTFGENTALVLDPALSADGKYCGLVRGGTAGAALAFGDLCYLNNDDSRWEKADANLGDGHNKILGMCVLAAAADGDPTTMLLIGTIRADTKFPTFTVGAPVYMSETAGEVLAGGDGTTGQPTTADVAIRVLGFALTADEMFFKPDNTYITHT